MEKEFITVEEFGKRAFIHLNKSDIAYFYANPDFKQDLTEEDANKEEFCTMTVIVLKSGEELYVFQSFEDLRRDIDFPLVDNLDLRFRIIAALSEDVYLIEYEHGRVVQVDIPRGVKAMD